MISALVFLRPILYFCLVGFEASFAAFRSILTVRKTVFSDTLPLIDSFEVKISSFSPFLAFKSAQD